MAAASGLVALADSWPGLPAQAAAPPPLPPSWYIPDNPAARAYRQQFNLSCEVASFKIVLLHYQLANVTEELLQDLLGVNEDPNKGFRGDYRALTTDGFRNYGAHAPALARLIERFPAPGRFRANALASLNDLRAALSRNWLVMVWIPVALEPSRAVPVRLSNGQIVILVPGEHAIVLHGYDGGGFFAYDPRPSPRVPGWVAADALQRGMSLFEHPALGIEPLF